MFLCCDKVFSIGPAQGRNFVTTKKFSVATKKKHEVEVNTVVTKKSLSRQEVEKQYKKNVVSNKFHVAT